jgi:hypothetical protein
VFLWFCSGAIGFVTVQRKAMLGLKNLGFPCVGLFVGVKAIMEFLEDFKARAGKTAPVPPMSL